MGIQGIQYNNYTINCTDGLGYAQGILFFCSELRRPRSVPLRRRTGVVSGVAEGCNEEASASTPIQCHTCVCDDWAAQFFVILTETTLYLYLTTN
jgi:hypothetical protein